MVTLNDATGAWPWPKPDGSMTALAKSWMVYVVLASPSSARLTVNVPFESDMSGTKIAEVSTGKFWSPSGSAGDQAGGGRRVIRKDANVAQVDADAAVPVDGVGQDGVASAGVDRVHADQDAIAGVEGDHVARAGRCAAEGVVRRAVVELHAVEPVAQRGGPGGVGADEVACDQVAGRGRAADLDAAGGVCRDHVARAGRGTPDGVAHGPGVDLHAVGTVRDGGGPGGVGADEVADDDVAGRARAESSTPSPVFPEITLARRRPYRRWCCPRRRC